MKKHKNTYSIIISLLFYTTLSAAPAAPHLMTFEQPDGSKFNGFLKGDEYFSWIQTGNKEVVIKNQTNGFYEFGMLAQDSEGKTQLQPSGVRIVERGISRRYLPIYLEPIKRSDLGINLGEKKAKETRGEKIIIAQRMKRNLVFFIGS